MVLNALLVGGVIVSLIFLFSSEVTPLSHEIFRYQNWIYLLIGLSGLYDLFYCQGAIPSIATYLKRNWIKAKVALWTGTLLPLLLFWLWMWFVATPSSEMKFVRAFSNYHPFFMDLMTIQQTTLGGAWITLVAVFGFLGGLLSTGVIFFDFFSDLLPKGKWLKRVGVCFLVAPPPAIISNFPHPTVRQIIGSVEGFGEVILGVFVPILCVWSIRYVQKTSYPNKIFCNKFILVSLALGGVFFFYIEGLTILDLVGW